MKIRKLTKDTTVLANTYAASVACLVGVQP